MERDALVYTANGVAYQAARMLLEAAGVLGLDDVPNPARLVDELVAHGWQVGINQERPVELPADYVVAMRAGARHGFWVKDATIGLVLALAAALRDEDPLPPQHDEGGLIW